jgi:hypothetical protein
MADSVNISGFGDPEANGEYLFSRESNGFPVYIKDNYLLIYKDENGPYTFEGNYFIAKVVNTPDETAIPVLRYLYKNPNTDLSGEWTALVTQTSGETQTGTVIEDDFSSSSDPQLWTPAEISTEGWWDASDVSTITESASRVSQLDDKSGNDQHLTQGIGSSQPHLTIETINNLNILYCDGGNWMETGDSAFAVPSNGNFSVFQVSEIFLDLDNVADGMFSMRNDSGRDWQFVGGVNKLNWNGRIIVNELGGVNTNFSPPMGIGGSIYNVVFDYDSSAITGYLTGSIRTGTTYTLQVTTPQNFKVFSNRGGNAPAGHLGETIIINDVSEATRQKVEGYLAWKWGFDDKLPIGHPYRNSAPTI